MQHEYAATGTATSYKAVGALTADGRWTFAPARPRRTAPACSCASAGDRQAKFSGTSSSSGSTSAAASTPTRNGRALHEEIMRRGRRVGRRVGAARSASMGGPVLVKVDVPGTDAAGKGLMEIDPARYGSLAHPGDGYAFDIFTQVARAMRDGRTAWAACSRSD